MPRPKLAWLVPTAVALVALGACLSVANWRLSLRPPGKLDPGNVSGYLNRLNRSRTPEAAAIRRELQDAAGALARERKLAAAEGIPIDPQQLQRPVPPPARNAAVEYVQIRNTGLGLPSNLQPMTYRRLYTPAEVALARQTLSANPAMMGLIRRATDKQKCVFQRNWALGPSVLFPEYAQMRGAARLLVTESCLLARDKRYDEAIAEQARGFRIAQHAASDPCLIAYLVGIACDAITLDGLEGILHTAGPNAHVADRVRAVVAANRPTFSFRYALTAEYASMTRVALRIARSAKPADFASLDDAMGGSPPQSPPPGPDWLTRLTHPDTARRIPASFSPEERRFIRQLTDAAEARMLHELHRQMDNATNPYPECLAFYRNYDPNGGLAAHDPVRLFTEILFPVFIQAQAKEVEARAKEEVLMAGAAVVAYRARRGAFPRRLKDALPGLPVDPFTRRPLKYRLEPNGFVVYSVGETGTFDGGKPGMKRDPRNAYFRWPGPRPTRE